MRIISYILAAVTSVCLIGALFWSCLESVAFDKAYFMAEYQRLDRAEATGLTQEGLDAATQALFDYIRGDRGNIDVQAAINGVRGEVFNATEKAHMQDVQRLYLLGSSVRYALWVLGGVCLLMLLFIARRESGRMLSRAYLITLIAVGTAAALAAVMITMDFARFWTGFHRVLFTNDLWLLNPATDVMIRMFPSAFFAGVVQSVLLRFTAVLGVLGAGAGAVLICTRRRKEAF